MKSRRGLSEIISVLIVIAIVVAGLGIYTGLSSQRILGETLTVREAIEQKDNQVSELLEFVNMFRVTDIHGNDDIIGIYVHNFGFKNITISKVFVNGSLDMDTISNPVYVRDLKTTPIWQDNKTLPVGNMTEIILNFTNAPVSPISGISSAVIVTDSNKIIQFLNETQ